MTRWCRPEDSSRRLRNRHIRGVQAWAHRRSGRQAWQQMTIDRRVDSRCTARPGKSIGSSSISCGSRSTPCRKAETAGKPAASVDTDWQTGENWWPWMRAGSSLPQPANSCSAATSTLQARIRRCPCLLSAGHRRPNAQRLLGQPAGESCRAGLRLDRRTTAPVDPPPTARRPGKDRDPRMHAPQR